MAKLFRDPPQPQAATPSSASEDINLATVAPAWWEASKGLLNDNCFDYGGGFGSIV